MKKRVVRVVSVAALLMAVASSAFYYKGLLNETELRLGVAEERLSEAHRDLRVLSVERDTVIVTLSKNKEEAGRLDKIAQDISKEIDDIYKDKKRVGRANEEIVEIVIVDHIGDELDGLLSRGYDEIYLQDDSR